MNEYAHGNKRPLWGCQLKDVNFWFWLLPIGMCCQFGVFATEPLAYFGLEQVTILTGICSYDVEFQIRNQQRASCRDCQPAFVLPMSLGSMDRINAPARMRAVSRSNDSAPISSSFSTLATVTIVWINASEITVPGCADKKLLCDSAQAPLLPPPHPLTNPLHHIHHHSSVFLAQGAQQSGDVFGLVTAAFTGFNYQCINPASKDFRQFG